MSNHDDEYSVKRTALSESLFTTEQSVIDWLADLQSHYIECEHAPGLARARLADHTRRLLYFATGHEFEVRQVVPPPKHPRSPRREWR